MKDRRLALGLLRTWRVHAVALVLLATGAAAVTAPELFQLPRLLSATPVVAPTSGLLALAVALGALVVAGEPAPALIPTAARAATTINLARVWVVALTGGLLVSTGGATPAAALAGVITLTGEGLLAAGVGGHMNFWVLPIAHLAVSVTFGGVYGTGRVAPWAWILSTDLTVAAAVASLALALLGSLVWRWRLEHPSVDAVPD